MNTNGGYINTNEKMLSLSRDHVKHKTYFVQKECILCKFGSYKKG